MRRIKVPAWFKGNGCSGAPDWLPVCGNIHECCTEHDWLYEMGGDEGERRFADQHLYECIMDHAIKRGHPRMGRVVAHLYYYAVRAFGWRFFAYYGGRRLGGLERLLLWLYSFAVRGAAFYLHHFVHHIPELERFQNDRR